MKSIFLDKDGTLIRDVPYNVDPDLIELAPGAGEGIRLLRAAGYSFFIVTNQPGVARGFFKEEDLLGVERKIREFFGGLGVPLSGFHYCPHHPEGRVPAYSVPCLCRKPEPGLIQRCARENGIDLRRSWLIGDILDDVEAGNRAGCRTILIDNGNESEWIPSLARRPAFLAADLADAAQTIACLEEKDREHEHGNEFVEAS